MRAPGQRRHHTRCESDPHPHPHAHVHPLCTRQEHQRCEGYGRTFRLLFSAAATCKPCAQADAVCSSSLTGIAWANCASLVQMMNEKFAVKSRGQKDAAAGCTGRSSVMNCVAALETAFSLLLSYSTTIMRQVHSIGIPWYTSFAPLEPVLCASFVRELNFNLNSQLPTC